MQLNFWSCSSLSTHTLLFDTLRSCCSCVRRSLLSLTYLIPQISHSFESSASLPAFPLVVPLQSAHSIYKGIFSTPYQYLEERHAFLDPNTSPRLPRWLLQSSLGPRSTIPSADPQYCRFSTCQPSRRRPRPISKTSCRPSVTTYHDPRRVRPWLPLPSKDPAAMPRSSCPPWRH